MTAVFYTSKRKKSLKLYRANKRRKLLGTYHRRRKHVRFTPPTRKSITAPPLPRKRKPWKEKKGDHVELTQKGGLDLVADRWKNMVL